MTADTPEQKAKDLFDKFYPYVSDIDPIGLPNDLSKRDNAKYCALIAAKEIVNSRPLQPTSDDYYELTSDKVDDAIEFWIAVKNHLVNMQDIKIGYIKRDAQYFTVTFHPNRIERIFGVREKTKRYKTEYDTYRSGGGFVYFDQEGNKLDNGDRIGIALDKFIRKTSFK